MVTDLVKSLYLRCSEEASSDPLSSTTDNHNTHIINLRHATKLDVIFEPLAPPTSYTRLPQLDTERIRRRVETNTSSKWREVRSRGVDVSTQAQELFDYISKMCVCFVCVCVCVRVRVREVLLLVFKRGECPMYTQWNPTIGADTWFVYICVSCAALSHNTRHCLLLG